MDPFFTRAANTLYLLLSPLRIWPWPRLSPPQNQRLLLPRHYPYQRHKVPGGCGYWCSMVVSFPFSNLISGKMLFFFSSMASPNWVYWFLLMWFFLFSFCKGKKKLSFPSLWVSRLTISAALFSLLSFIYFLLSFFFSSPFFYLFSFFVFLFFSFFSCFPFFFFFVSFSHSRFIFLFSLSHTEDKPKSSRNTSSK